MGNAEHEGLPLPMNDGQRHTGMIISWTGWRGSREIDFDLIFANIGIFFHLLRSGSASGFSNLERTAMH